MKFNYFYLPNILIDEEILTTDFSVAVYLFSLLNQNRKNSLGFCVKVKQTTIAAACGISKETAARAVARLMKRGIIYKRIRTIKKNRYLGTYTYILQSPKQLPGGYFKVNRAIYKSLCGKALRGYIICCKNRNNRTKKFFHSYSDLAAQLKVKRSEAIKIIKFLFSEGYIKKIVRKTKLSDHAENLYVVCDEICNHKSKPKRKKELLQSNKAIPKSVNPFSDYMINHFCRFVKGVIGKIHKKISKSLLKLRGGG